MTSIGDQTIARSLFRNATDQINTHHKNTHQESGITFIFSVVNVNHILNSL